MKHAIAAKTGTRFQEETARELQGAPAPRPLVVQNDSRRTVLVPEAEHVCTCDRQGRAARERRSEMCGAAQPERLCASLLCACIALNFDARELPLHTTAPQNLQRAHQSWAERDDKMRSAETVAAALSRLLQAERRGRVHGTAGARCNAGDQKVRKAIGRQMKRWLQRRSDQPEQPRICGTGCSSCVEH